MLTIGNGRALAQKHGMALLGTRFTYTESCSQWAYPADGSAAALLRSLEQLAQESNHAELPKVPWVLWGHSGGGNWAMNMTFMYLKEY